GKTPFHTSLLLRRFLSTQRDGHTESGAMAPRAIQFFAEPRFRAGGLAAGADDPGAGPASALKGSWTGPAGTWAMPASAQGPTERTRRISSVLNPSAMGRRTPGRTTTS